MKTLNKAKIKQRFENTEIKPYYALEQIKPFSRHGLKFDLKLTIVIPGNPISDSRPKFTTNFRTGTSHVYNPHKENLMKVFNEIYKESDELQGLTILSPTIFNIEVYSCVTQVMRKKLGPKEEILLNNEELYCMNKKDNDNFEKVHFDVLQDKKYQVILRDETIVENTTKKLYVNDPKKERVKIEIFISRFPKWMEHNVKSSKEYLSHIISMKYKFINNISDEDWSKTFYKNIAIFYKSNKIKIDSVLKTVAPVLKYNYNKTSLALIDTSKNIDIILSNIEKLLGGIQR